jgi:hypothetical protein
MNQTFKTFLSNTMGQLQNDIITFSEGESINPTSLGLTEALDGGYLAIVGFDNTKSTPVKFVSHTTSFKLSQEALEEAINADELIDESNGDEIICHAVLSETIGAGDPALTFVLMIAQ